MSILVLTQTGGILKPFAIILGFIMNYIYRFLQIFGINNVALTIILFTLVINVLMIPLTVKQQKFSKMSSLMNPELQKVQKKYQNRKDEKSMRMMQAETQAIYDGGIVNGLTVDKIIAINNLKYSWQFILENEKIDYDFKALCHLHKLTCDKLVLDQDLGRLRSTPVLKN